MDEFELSEKAQKCLADAAKEITAGTTGKSETLPNPPMMRQLLSAYVVRKFNPSPHLDDATYDHMVQEALIDPFQKKPPTRAEDNLQYTFNALILRGQLVQHYDRCMDGAPSFMPKINGENKAMGGP